MKLSLTAAVYDITNAKGDLVATAYRRESGLWAFKDYRDSWFVDSHQRIEDSQILEEYRNVKRLWNAARKAEKMRRDLTKPPKFSQLGDKK